MKWLLSVGVLSLTCGASCAKEPFAYTGFGTVTCAEITRLQPADKTPTGAAVMSWAQGFLSGMNINQLAHNEPMRDLGVLTTEDQLGFLLNYCDKHQLHQFAQAVFSLYGGLPQIPPKN